MLDLIKDHIEGVITAVFVVYFGIRAALALKKAERIEKEGIETDAVVARINEVWDPDAASSTYETVVRFTDDQGEVRECPMAYAPAAEHDVGDSVRIRYIPGEFDLVREIKE